MRMERRKRLVKHVAEWHKLAKHDIEKAEDDLKRGWYSDSCFYSQQACEKILKAFLRSKGAVVRGHRIERLLKLSSEYGLDVGDLIKDEIKVRELSDQYTSPRYPNFKGKTVRAFENYTEEFARVCFELAGEIWRKVERHLKRESLV